MSWHVNEGLQPLINAARAKYRNITVYTIGDVSHKQRISDHNPNTAGRVNAADFMISPAFQHSDAVQFCEWIIRDGRTKYAIYNRRIWQDGVWSEYTGNDPHTNHVHQSVWDSAYTNTSQWQLEGKAVPRVAFSVSLPLVGQGDNDKKYDGYNMIFRIQTMANSLGFGPIDVDGIWGPATTKALGYSKMNEERYRALFGLTK